jgi:two-component sensor histidine kinase
MLQVCRRVDSADDVAALFSEEALARALPNASGILVQVFWNESGISVLEAVCSAVVRAAPRAVLVGVSSAGQVAEGLLVRDGLVVSVSCFKGATLAPFSLEVAPGKESQAGWALADSLAGCVDLKAALLFASPAEIDAASVVRGLREAIPALVLFGGGAAQGSDRGSGVLIGGKVSSLSLVAVAFCGRDLHVETRTLFDWRPLGPPLTLTEVERGCIRKINDRPALDHYRENLDLEDGDDLYFLEFPLLMERDGVVVARNTLSVEADGGIRIVADAFTGESARLGYLDVDALMKSIGRAVRSLRAFCPEGIFLYSCVCRLFTLQEEIESETLPFQGIAPTSGVFTSGEFCRLGDRMQLLNSSEVIVALREGPPSARVEGSSPAASSPADPSRERHARVTSHLFRFIGALTERIEVSNRVLLLKNSQLAAINESLCAEVVERKKAEEHEKAIAEEKAILLRELQHRVKNSLAIISSIASIEARQSPAPEARAALEKLESRIGALASLYDILYATGDVEEIGLADYLGRVVDYAAEGLGADAKGIAIARELANVRIELKRAIPLGLIVNELVTDSLKYAFPAKKGRVALRLLSEGGYLVLNVEDDGVGLPPGFNPARASGFGLTLVMSLAAQLGATFSARSEGGAKFELRMPLPL